MTPVTRDLSFFRSRPYLEKLENVMESFVSWTKVGTDASCESPKEKKVKAKMERKKGKGFGN